MDYRRLLEKKTWPLWLALMLLLAALAKPTFDVERDIYNYVFVIDITQSMNARDYHVDDMPADRLSFVKESIRHALQKLPCQSKVGVGLFTTQNMFLLFEPLEVCEHYAVIEESLMKIDWRMAWAADSHIARGLYASIKELKKMESKPNLVFFSDGQQTPSSVKEPPFLLKPGEVGGLIMGVGNLAPVTVPRLDPNNIEMGVWKAAEAEVVGPRGNRSFVSAEGNYLTMVNEDALTRLAGITGMQYRRLDTPERLGEALQSPQWARPAIVAGEIGWLLALAALASFLLPYLLHARRVHR
ncbi:MAG: VWA domain-containing protein [Gammaproteobacteria bacterium]